MNEEDLKKIETGDSSECRCCQAVNYNAEGVMNDLISEIRRLKSVLIWYAARSSYNTIEHDLGQRAREALE